MSNNDLKDHKVYTYTFSRQGFTLIELIAVVIIIAILASIAVPTYNNFVEKSRATEALATLKTILDAQKRYAFKYSTYATIPNQLDVTFDSEGEFYNFSLVTTPNPYNSNNNETIATATRDIDASNSIVINITESGYFSDVISGSIGLDIVP